MIGFILKYYKFSITMDNKHTYQTPIAISNKVINKKNKK